MEEEEETGLPLALGGLQAHGPVCVCSTLCLCQAVRGQQGEARGGRGGGGREALDIKLLEPAPVDQRAPTRPWQQPFLPN